MAAADPTLAAIAGDPAQEAYGLQTVAAQIQDDPHNRTRFVVVCTMHVNQPARTRLP